MTRRRSAPYCLCAAALMRVSHAGAGVWGVDPSIGITGDYATNPGLLLNPAPHTAAAHGALLFDSPTTYNGNAFEFSVTPSFRFSDSAGYSSLASNYEHLAVKAEFDAERSVLTASGALKRDSSLYQDYLTDGSAGVRRDTLVAQLNWQRSLTERVDFNTEVSSTEVKYGKVPGVGTLTDYRYTSIAPAVSWKSSERNKFTVTASGSRYNSLDGATVSRSANLQAGFIRQLTEIWSLEADVGYSRALNSLKFYQEFLVFTPHGPVIEFVPVKLESSQNGTVYTANLSRKGTLLSFSAIASRQLVPSGFAFLSQQQSLEFTTTYSHSERWSFQADAYYLKARDAELRGGASERTPVRIACSASWRWTEHWTATLGAARVTERVRPPDADLASNEVTITLSRQFDHLKFQ
jgi:hypothetical protein